MAVSYTFIQKHRLLLLLCSPLGLFLVSFSFFLLLLHPALYLALQFQTSGGPGRACFNCGQEGHRANECPTGGAAGGPTW